MIGAVGQFIRIVALCLITNSTLASELTLVMPSQLDKGHRYYHELLYEALLAQGLKLHIEVPSAHIPQKRAFKMLERNKLDIAWMISTKQRDQKYTVVDVPLTGGLIGRRVLLIPPELQLAFNTIHSLEDLRESGLVAGLGVKWFDVKVWQASGLAYYPQDGEWREIYPKLSVDGDVNYFPRGMNEIIAEANLHSYLAIEQRLILEYSKDFKFYLSGNAAKYKPIIEKALKEAQESGLMDKLMQKYWTNTFDRLNLEERIVIKLAQPE